MHCGVMPRRTWRESLCVHSLLRRCFTSTTLSKMLRWMCRHTLGAALYQLWTSPVISQLSRAVKLSTHSSRAHIPKVSDAVRWKYDAQQTRLFELIRKIIKTTSEGTECISDPANSAVA